MTDTIASVPTVGAEGVRSNATVQVEPTDHTGRNIVQR